MACHYYQGSWYLFPHSQILARFAEYSKSCAGSKNKAGGHDDEPLFFTMSDSGDELMPTSQEISSYLSSSKDSDLHAKELSKGYGFLAANVQNTHDSSLAFAYLKDDPPERTRSIRSQSASMFSPKTSPRSRRTVRRSISPR